MKTILQILILAGLTSFALASDVTIPDPGLNAAVRAALQKPNGSLTDQDLLSLTNLNARGRNIANLQGLEAAHHLTLLDLQSNQLVNLTMPAGLTNLAALVLNGNQLTNITLPPDMTNLFAFFFGGNPLTSFVLPDILASNNLASVVASLQNQGIPVFIYPLTVKLVKLQGPVGAFRFALIGPPDVYTILSSTNLIVWSALDAVANPRGGIFVTDSTANQSAQKFYQSLRQNPATNLVFIPANTFTLGSPTNEVGHRADESPQTTVTLTHGFWMGKFLVTQREYLAVTGENPSGFPGDLDRPVESVSWFAASNYCVLLTLQESAAGRIPPGTHFRLPTEAEWECAARAGTTTRFNYGDDPDLTSLTNHAWFGDNSGFTTRPVGLKLPNNWGLFDMAGNVWEWCQDWYGPYPGGSIADPQGAPSNQIGFKVIRGGAWEASALDCRSARRWFEGASPFINDFIIGFRVVLVTGN